MARRVIVRTVRVRDGDEVTLADGERIVGAWPAWTAEDGGTNWIVLCIGSNA